MGTIIINNYSRIEDFEAVSYAGQILSGLFDVDYLIQKAQMLRVNVVKMEENMPDGSTAQVFNFSDREA